MNEVKKLDEIGRQAMNIQVAETVLKNIDADGKPIDGTEQRFAFLYNLEKISKEEVEHLIKSGEWVLDSRILQTDLETISNIFPHRGEAKKGSATAYWRSLAYRNNFIHCECSVCEFRIEAIKAVKIGKRSEEYVDVIYRFCPNCGSPMSCKAEEGEV